MNQWALFVNQACMLSSWISQELSLPTDHWPSALFSLKMMVWWSIPHCFLLLVGKMLVLPWYYTPRGWLGDKNQNIYVCDCFCICLEHVLILSFLYLFEFGVILPIAHVVLLLLSLCVLFLVDYICGCLCERLYAHERFELFCEGD